MGTIQSTGTTDFPPQQYSGAPQTQDFPSDFPAHTPGTTPQTHVFPVQTQVVGQTRVVPIQTTVVHGRSDTCNQSSGAGIWIGATVLRVLCAMTSTGVLIAAAVAVSAINEVDDMASERGGEYENAGRYRGAAGWLVFVGCAAIIFHVIMISIQILYFKCTIKKHFSQFAITNAIFCILFAIALLAGGIANAVYAADNSELWTDACFFTFRDEDEICRSLARVRDAEIASVALSFISMLLLVVLFFFMLCTGLAAASSNQSFSSQPQGAVPYPSQPQGAVPYPSQPQGAVPYPSQSHVSAYPPTNTSQYQPPTNTSQYPDPSAPPSYDGFANPPSYESATAPSYGASTY